MDRCNALSFIEMDARREAKKKEGKKRAKEEHEAGCELVEREAPEVKGAARLPTAEELAEEYWKPDADELVALAAKGKEK